MARLIKRKSKDWIAYTALRKLSVEDDEHEAELAKGDTFYIGLSKGNILFIDPEDSEYYAYVVKPDVIGKMIAKQLRQAKQTIPLAKAYEIYKTIYFPKLKKIKVVSKLAGVPKDVAGNWNPTTKTLYTSLAQEDWLGSLLHEMIHQHLTEIGNTEFAHGKTFKRISKQVNANDIDWKKELKADIAKYGLDYEPYPLDDGQVTSENLPDFACANDGKEIHKFFVASFEPNNNIVFGMRKVNGKIKITTYQAEILLKPKPADIKEIKAMFGSNLESDLDRFLEYLHNKYN